MLKDSFCSSPWFHLRINPNGDFIPCRWNFTIFTSAYNIRNSSIAEFMNSDTMCDLRTSMLNGSRSEVCSSCYNEDNYNKISGRSKQLLKSGIDINNFEKTLCSSPHFARFEYSLANQGKTSNLPVDLQIDLGNTCNSSCIMCYPIYSSKLAEEYKVLRKIEPTLFATPPISSNWSNDAELVDKFVNELKSIPNLRYLHFLGGETLYLKSFYDICNRLIDLGLAKNISIGTTTNCTVYNEKLEYIIHNFKHVHLGLSVESLNRINDYIRYPSTIDRVRLHIEKFLDLRRKTNLHLSLRITPTIFSIYHLDTLLELMINEGISAESCNILVEPSCLRIELLPKELIKICLDKINQIIEKFQLVQTDQTIINRRRDDLVDTVIAQVIFEYKNLLENLVAPTNIEEERHKLVKYIKAFEQVHENTILDYLPEYEEFLRSYGY